METDTDPKDGHVEAISWGSSGTSQVSINAAGVKDTKVRYASYTWDGHTTLHLSQPTTTPLPPSAPAAPTPNPPTIVTLEIASWGSFTLRTPLKWAGPPTGTATIVFRQRTSISGPIGNVNGP